MENRAFPKPFIKFVWRPRILSSPRAKRDRKAASGLDKSLGREGIIGEWA
ncbi:MAG: hypothetical protein FD163_1398 [Hyphomonadaceae bacterium]|nr:MAG: hypothetical protein FD128_486 [Hyphomonadaceae bacterium]KAF0184701.1 MAG: hypothetical protein FD163_1398 [Hyphomonadaceae bacterium]